MTPAEWLASDRNYEAGVKIYNELGSNANYKRLFARQQTQYTINQLAYEIGKLVTVEPSAVIEQTTADDFTKPEQIKYQKIDSEKLPPVLKEKEVLKGKLYHEASYAHSLMRNAKTDDERKEYASLIVKNINKTDKIWTELDHFQTNGKLLPVLKQEVDIEIMTEVNLIKYRNNLRALISKNKKKKHKANELIEQKKQLEIINEKLKTKYGS